MGSGRWSDSDWRDYAARASYGSRSTHDIFNARGLDKSLDPRGVKMRESRDSNDNPNSTALIVALDVTGSMGCVLDAMARQGLNTLCTEVYTRKPVTDPHIMCMGIGDVEAGDRAPLQVTQFEADLRIAQQLEKIYLEGGGGGNSFESYALAWHFAARHTSIDCMEKRGKKGYLFTIGDEEPTPRLSARDIERVLGYRPQQDVRIDQLLTEVSRKYEIFHVVVEEGSHFRAAGPRVTEQWNRAIGQRALHLPDHTRLAEVIVSAIQINEGANTDDVVRSWDGSTAMVVARATRMMQRRAMDNIGVVTI